VDALLGETEYDIGRFGWIPFGLEYGAILFSAVKGVSMHSVLAENWRKCGIDSGDTILIHSNILRVLCMHRIMEAQVVLDSFLEAVGAEGMHAFGHR